MSGSGSAIPSTNYGDQVFSSFENLLMRYKKYGNLLVIIFFFSFIFIFFFVLLFYILKQNNMTWNFMINHHLLLRLDESSPKLITNLLISLSQRLSLAQCSASAVFTCLQTDLHVLTVMVLILIFRQPLHARLSEGYFVGSSVLLQLGQNQLDRTEITVILWNPYRRLSSGSGDLVYVVPWL